MATENTAFGGYNGDGTDVEYLRTPMEDCEGVKGQLGAYCRTGTERFHMEKGGVYYVYNLSVSAGVATSMSSRY